MCVSTVSFALLRLTTRESLDESRETEASDTNQRVTQAVNRVVHPVRPMLCSL